MPLPVPFLLPGQGVGEDGALREFDGADPAYDAESEGAVYDERDAYGKKKSDYLKQGVFLRCEDQPGRGKRVGTLPPLPFPPPSPPPLPPPDAKRRRKASDGGGGEEEGRGGGRRKTA